MAEDTHIVIIKSESNTTVIIKDTVEPLGFILLEDGGILLQENDLPIALE